MTWTKALPVLAVSLVFDALRLLFEMFWFFGPALAALYCTAKVSSVVGTTLGGFACSAGAGVLGFVGAGPIAAFGVVMAMAVGLLGWMTVGLIVIMTNARLFKENAGHALWFIGSLMVSEVPFVGALPAITISVVRMYSTQIKNDKAAREEYEKARVAEQNRNRQQQAAQLTQARNEQIMQIQEQEAANDEMYALQEETEAINDEQYTQDMKKAA